VARVDHPDGKLEQALHRAHIVLDIAFGKFVEQGAVNSKIWPPQA
jgi:hypothetical protein